MPRQLSGDSPTCFIALITGPLLLLTGLAVVTRPADGTPLIALGLWLGLIGWAAPRPQGPHA